MLRRALKAAFAALHMEPLHVHARMTTSVDADGEARIIVLLQLQEWSLELLPLLTRLEAHLAEVLMAELDFADVDLFFRLGAPPSQGYVTMGSRPTDWAKEPTQKVHAPATRAGASPKRLAAVASPAKLGGTGQTSPSPSDGLPSAATEVIDITDHFEVEHLPQFTGRSWQETLPMERVDSGGSDVSWSETQPFDEAGDAANEKHQGVNEERSLGLKIFIGGI